MATPQRNNKEKTGKSFSFEGKNLSSGEMIRGEVAAKSEEEARAKLARRRIQVIQIQKIKKRRQRRIKAKDIMLFTRQLATMVKAGLPLLTSFEIIAKGSSNPSITHLLMQIRADIEQGTSMSDAFAKHPDYFDRFYCNLVGAGEAGGVLEAILERLATYQEKIHNIKRKVRNALIYPIAVMVVAIGLVAVMMIWVLPEFGKVYSDMGAPLPALTQVVMHVSDFSVAYGWIIFLAMLGAGFGLYFWHKKSFDFQKKLDRLLLKLPLFGIIVKKATVARWARTTAILFSAGVPMVDTLSSVEGASGSIIYDEATSNIRSKVIQGVSLTSSMQSTELFPSMVEQMTAIGEESGSLDDMLNKSAEFYEDEVDSAVDQLSTLMEPIIIVVLGVIIGFLLVAMYLPLFNLGNVVG